MATTFEFIPLQQRNMYETAFNAITQLELWSYVNNFSDDICDSGKSFIFSNAEEVDRIYKKIEELGYNGHSGASFGFTMRTMEYIGKNGLAKFQEEYLSQTNP